MAITKESVFECADQLLEQGVKPTLAKVRSALGGGSFTTISEFMAEWRDQHEASNQPKPLQIPDAVLDTASQLTNQIWVTATAAAESRLDAERKALNEAREAMESEQHEAAEMADQMSVEIEQLQSQLAEAGELAEQSIEALETKDTELQKVLVSLARSETHVEDLDNEVKQAHAEAKSAEQKAIQCETTNIGQANEIKALTAIISDLRQDLTTANGRADKAEGQLEEVQLAKIDLDETVAKIRDELGTATVEAKTAQALNEQLVGDKAELKVSLNTVSQELQKALAENARLQALADVKIDSKE